MRNFRLFVGEQRCLSGAGWLFLLIGMAATACGSFLYAKTAIDVIVRAAGFVDKRLLGAFPAFPMLIRLIEVRIGGLILGLGFAIVWSIGHALVRWTGIPLTVEIPDEPPEADSEERDWEWSSRRGP